MIDFSLVAIYNDFNLFLAKIKDDTKKKRVIKLHDYTKSPNDTLKDILNKNSGTDPQMWKLIKYLEDKARARQTTQIKDCN